MLQQQAQQAQQELQAEVARQAQQGEQAHQAQQAQDGPDIELLESSRQLAEEMHQSMLDLRGQGDDQFDWEARAHWEEDPSFHGSPCESAAETGSSNVQCVALLVVLVYCS